MENIIYSKGRNARSNRARNYESTWQEFVEDMTDYATQPGYGVAFTGEETHEEYSTKKKQQNWIAASFDNRTRSNDNVMQRSILFIDMDGVTNRQVRKIADVLEAKDITYFAHGTSSDRHALKGGSGCRAVRFLIPTNRPMDADEIWYCQHALFAMLRIEDMDGIDATANQRARLMFVPPFGAECWQHDGKPVRVSKLLALSVDVPSESGTTKWNDAALANASENSQAIAGWAFEMGLEMMSSGRGWAVQCPNHMAHSNNDGTDGSTAILLPDSLHPEVRFNCQHDHCKGLNSHQHMMLQLVGVPNAYLPEAHNISRKQIAELMPFMDDEEVEHIHQNQVAAAAEGVDAHQCQDEDLMDEPCALFTKRDPIIDGLYNFKSTFELVGESNIGKSFFLLGQMACAAAGIPFAGAKVIKSHCFYFDAEGGSTTEDRKQALQLTYGDPLDWLHIIDLQHEGWDITSTAGRKAIIRYIRTVAGNDPVGLVAFDSLNQSVSLSATPFDENSSADMGTVASALKSIADETGACAGVVHHPAKSEKGTRRVGRGSGALHGAVDFVYFIEQPDEAKPLQLNFYMEKARAGVKQLPRGFVLAKCKIEVEQHHNDAIVALQSDRDAPDFSAFIEGHTAKPFDSAPRDETLVLIPVALAPFVTAAADVARKAAREANDDRPGLTKEEAAIIAALEELQAADDRPQGYPVGEIVRLMPGGGNARRRSLVKEMAERGLICYGKDHKGRLQNGEDDRHLQFRITGQPTDYNDVQPTEEEDDLAD